MNFVFVYYLKMERKHILINIGEKEMIELKYYRHLIIER